MTPTLGKTPPRIQLDWSKLVVFDQATRSDDLAAAAKLNDPRLAKVGSKGSVGFAIRR